MSHGNPPPSPHHPDYLLPWQSSERTPPDPPPDPAGVPAPAPGRHSDLRRCAPRTGCCGASRP